jgi:redox-sensitive bicupin YhaK (pirin superfamily)
MTMIEMVIEQRRRDLGGGLAVGRVLPFAKRRMVGPFIFFDIWGRLISNRVSTAAWMFVHIPISAFRP